MTWSSSDEQTSLQLIVPGSNTGDNHRFRTVACSSCGHTVEIQDQVGGVQNLPGLPAGVKFDPSDQEILQHLEAKVLSDVTSLHPLIDEFIPTIHGENGICYTHPNKLPGVNKDGQVRHFFHRPSKAYTTGTRKRRKVDSDPESGETRWHKTGKTRPVSSSGHVKGYKKILVLYTNYGRQRKPEKTNWVMHQYHLGNSEEEKDGELVISKVFYQTQPRQCSGSSSSSMRDQHMVMGDKSKSSSKSSEDPSFVKTASFCEYYNAGFVPSYNVGSQNDSLLGHANGSSDFIHLSSGASKGN